MPLPSDEQQMLRQDGFLLTSSCHEHTSTEHTSTDHDVTRIDSDATNTTLTNIDNSSSITHNQYQPLDSEQTNTLNLAWTSPNNSVEWQEFSLSSRIHDTTTSDPNESASDSPLLLLKSINNNNNTNDLDDVLSAKQTLTVTDSAKEAITEVFHNRISSHNHCSRTHSTQIPTQSMASEENEIAALALLEMSTTATTNSVNSTANSTPVTHLAHPYAHNRHSHTTPPFYDHHGPAQPQSSMTLQSSDFSGIPVPSNDNTVDFGPTGKRKTRSAAGSTAGKRGRGRSKASSPSTGTQRKPTTTTLNRQRRTRKPRGGDSMTAITHPVTPPEDNAERQGHNGEENDGDLNQVLTSNAVEPVVVEEPEDEQPCIVYGYPAFVLNDIIGSLPTEMSHITLNKLSRALHGKDAIHQQPKSPDDLYTPRY